MSHTRLEESKRFLVPAIFLVVFVAYATLRIANFNTMQEPKQCADTVSYMRKASMPLFRRGYHIGPLFGIFSWGLSGRSPTVPFLYKLVGRDPWAIAGLQLGLAISCWGLLALFVARAVRVPQLKPIAFLCILLFALSDSIILWDGLLLSESISLSLMALFIGSWLWLLDGWSRQKMALMLATALLWGFTRDTNAWVLLLIASMSAVAGSLWRSQRHYLLVATILAVFFVGNEISSNWAQRWRVPLVNVIGQRVLLDPESRAYFAQLGMPLTPAVLLLSGQFAWDHDRAFFYAPALQDFRDWVSTRGKSSYLRFLFTHPHLTLGAPLQNAATLLTPPFKDYPAAGFSPILKGTVAPVFYFQETTFLWLWTFGVVVAVVVAVAARKVGPTWLVPLALILLTYPHALIVWHGDTAEIGRHALQVGVQSRLGLWIALVFGADLLLGERRQKIIHAPAKI